MIIAADHLIPLFKTNGVDIALARRMAISAIDAYQPETRADYINVARTIAFSITALALLGKAASDDMTMAQKMSAFGRANTLNRSADQSERSMMQRRRQQQANPPVERPEPTPDLPAPAQAFDNPVGDIPMIHRAVSENAAIDDAELQAAIGEVMKEYMAAGMPVSIDPTTPAPPPPQALSRIRPTTTTPASVLHYDGPGLNRLQPQSAPYKAGLAQNTAVPRCVGQGAPPSR